MKTFRFIANDATQALAQIHAKLGPEAVVLSVRRLAPQGFAKLWQSSGGVEVLAGVPDAEPGIADAHRPFASASRDENSSAFSVPRWQTVAWLETMGLQPEHATHLQSHLNAIHGDAAFPSIEAEWSAVSATLASFWREPNRIEDKGPPRPHVFIGPAGSGKTTVLCKWLTLAVLTEEKHARVWRMDGQTANTAEFLGIHCEMLGTPVERFWSGLAAGGSSLSNAPLAGSPAAAADLLFVDLPGVEHRDTQAMDALRAQLAVMPSPRLHLVLNAAYEMDSLLAQWHAFAPFNPEDLIFTHLDEEARRVKLWNFIFGTNCSIRFLSAGQKVPGEFQRALPGLLFPS